MSGAGWQSVVTTVLPRRAARARWRRLLPDATPASRPVDLVALVRRRMIASRPRVQMSVAAGIAATVGIVLDGPMAALILAGYAATAIGLLLRNRMRTAHARSQRFAVDAVAALAAELRAGLAVSAALAAASGSLEGPMVVGPGAAGVARRVAESISLAESSGAPLADVLDRLDAHLRAVDRASAAAAAQAAGARASAWLLAMMPLAGVGIGFVIGADPLRVLLHTPIGAACLLGATALQLAGLAWAGRLSRIEVPV